MLNAMLISTLASLVAVMACDPTTTTCPAIPAMPSSITYDLTTSNSADFSYIMPTRISQDGSGLDFAVASQGDAPTLVTNDYLLYGNVKATIKSAPGTGMVSAFILMSDVLDEIDLEWLGVYDSQVQTNYFYRGQTASYDRGGTTNVATPEETTHVYEIDWTSTTLRWIIDGVTVRTLNKADTSGYGYPSTPCQIKIGVWASGDPTNEAGTISWGGGPIDYSKGPYKMTLQSLSVTSYTTASSFIYAAGGQTFSISQDAVKGSAAPSAAAAAKTTAKSAAGTATVAAPAIESTLVTSATPKASTTTSSPKGTTTAPAQSNAGVAVIAAAAQVTTPSSSRTTMATSVAARSTVAAAAAASASSPVKSSASAVHATAPIWLALGLASLSLMRGW